jgi:hypothetical protein
MWKMFVMMINVLIESAGDEIHNLHTCTSKDHIVAIELQPIHENQITIKYFDSNEKYTDWKHVIEMTKLYI